MTETKVRTNALLRIPEVAGLDAKSSLIRIPPELDVPLTSRVRKIIDTPEFHRLCDLDQLGFVSLIYPGARSSRFEHSLGVYRLSLLILKRLAHDPRFADMVRPEDAELFIAAALLHDIGHYPYCHLIEDLKLPNIVPHEESARVFLEFGELSRVLVQEWNIHPREILALLNGHAPVKRGDDSEQEHARRTKVYRLFASIISGPIDIDKMDYLFRDSHAAGVPYGRHFDQDRLIGSLCLNAEGDGLAITDKGKTAAELMVFARYVMFSEVYWHHAVRSATVMFQSLFHILAGAEDGNTLIQASFWRSTHAWQKYLLAKALARGNSMRARYYQERHGLRKPAASWHDTLADADENEFDAAAHLARALFGRKRQLYKRVCQFSILEEPELYEALSGLPYQKRRALVARLVDRINRSLDENGGANATPDCGQVSVMQAATEQAGCVRLCQNDILIDSPPAEKEVEFKIDVYYPREDRYRPLADVSPVVRSLAQEQFDDYVKRVRIFARGPVAKHLRQAGNLSALIREILQ
ncbi:MAG: HD domain-containing protein [Planctomycetia bacterium]|nr:HD domain-containing protein [Planctomycetia bacterium]